MNSYRITDRDISAPSLSEALAIAIVVYNARVQAPVITTPGGGNATAYNQDYQRYINRVRQVLSEASRSAHPAQE